MTFRPHLAYSASAGSGKTFALAVRYVSLLFMGESPSAILAATFTNKAASEMRQRVVDSLRYLGENEAFLEEVMKQTGLSRDEIFARQSGVLDRFLSQSSHIVTLDSFFSSILRSASLEIGLEPDFVTKEQDSDDLVDHFLDEVYMSSMLPSLVKLAINIEDKRFNKIFDQMQSFYKIDPLLPKSRYRVENLATIENQIDTLRAQIHNMLIESKASKTAINNFAPSQIKDFVTKSLFAKETLTEHRNYKKYVEQNPQIDESFMQIKELIAEWMRAKEAIVLHNLFEIYDYYRNARVANAKKSGNLTFDDLTYFTYRLLYEAISKDFLYFKLDAKFRHILLDEFQDTSTLQFLLLKPLIDEIFAGEGQGEFRSFFYVGDTKQSLYRFRGGVEELFDKVAQKYEIDVQPMDTNYRSSRVIIEQVNRWFEPIMDGYIPQKSREGASEGYLEVLCPYTNSTESTPDEADEMINVAIGQVKKLLDLGVDVDDIAFLVHTNKDGQNLQEACQKEGIATMLKTSSSLKNLPKIASLVAMVEYLYRKESIDAMSLLQMVDKSIDQIDTSWFSPFASPLEVLDRLIREFGYFDDDPNILKLLDFASGFSDIDTFLQEFADSNISLASNTIHGAKIMTIHGSKGLEFDYVIVLDRLTQENGDRSAILYHYDDNLYVDSIYYRLSKRDNFDKSYAKILAERKKSSQKDTLNKLYVALTRAVKGLIVLKKSEKSIFDILQMQPMQIGSIEIKHKSTDKSTPKAPPPITISNYGTQEVEKVSEDEDRDRQAMLFGSALHYALEMLESFDLKNLDNAMQAVKNRYAYQLSSEEIEDIRNRVANLISNREFQALLNGAILTKELSLVYDGEFKQVDLLLESDEHNLVIDYKSSQKFAYKHQSQVEHYKKAISKITGKQTEGMVVYLLEDSIEIERV